MIIIIFTIIFNKTNSLLLLNSAERMKVLLSVNVHKNMHKECLCIPDSRKLFVFTMPPHVALPRCSDPGNTGED